MPRRSTLASLKFREALTTKGLSSSELTKRLQVGHRLDILQSTRGTCHTTSSAGPTDFASSCLCLQQALHKELGSLDQEQVDTKSLDKVSKELISTTLLLGKDRGVKAYVACCLADLLRLYAPDAPYTADQLRVSPASETRLSRMTTCLGDPSVLTPSSTSFPQRPPRTYFSSL